MSPNHSGRQSVGKAVLAAGLLVVVLMAFGCLRSPSKPQTAQPVTRNTSPIAGQLTDATGSPLPDVPVYLRPAGTEGGIQEAADARPPEESTSGTSSAESDLASRGAAAQPARVPEVDLSGLIAAAKVDMRDVDTPSEGVATATTNAAARGEAGDDLGETGSEADPGTKVATSDKQGGFSMKTLTDGAYVLSAKSGDAYAELRFTVKNGYVNHVDGRTDNLLELSVPVYSSKPAMLPPVGSKDTTIDEQGMTVVKNVVEVVWKESVPASEHKQVLDGIGGLKIRGEIGALGVTEVEVTGGDVAGAMSKLAASSKVATTTKDYVVEPDLVPKDPDWANKSRSWWLRRIRANQVYDIIKLKKPKIAIVAVIDSGFQKHPDLKKVFIKSLARNYTDQPYGAKPRHGNHVTGLIAMQSNEIGLVGISPRTQIVPMKVASYAQIAEAIDAAAKIRGVTVISISWGNHWKRTDQERTAQGLPPLTRAEQRAFCDAQDSVLMPAIRAAKEKGVVVVHSAGNDGADASLNMMNDQYDLITVAASRAGDRLASFSNSGTPVTLMAPGQAIWSTVGDSGWDFANGTSMSTPIVAGTVALMRALNPALEPREVQGLLVQSCDKVEGAPPRLNSWKAALAAMKDSYGIVGKVLDETGKPVANAVVKVDGEPGLSAVTTQTGLFVFAAVPKSKWHLTALGAAAGGGKARQGGESVIPAGADELIREGVVIRLGQDSKPPEVPKEEGYVVVNVTNYGSGGYRTVLRTDQLKYPLDVSSLPGGGRTPSAGKLAVIGGVHKTEEEAAKSFAGQIKDYTYEGSFNGGALLWANHNQSAGTHEFAFSAVFLVYSPEMKSREIKR